MILIDINWFIDIYLFLYCRCCSSAKSDFFNLIIKKLSNYQLSNYQLSNYQLSNYQLSNYQLSNYQLSNYQLSNPITRFRLLLSKSVSLVVVKPDSKTGSCLARLSAWQWGSKIFSPTTDHPCNLDAGPLDEFHLVLFRSLQVILIFDLHHFFGYLSQPCY